MWFLFLIIFFYLIGGVPGVITALLLGLVYVLDRILKESAAARRQYGGRKKPCGEKKKTDE